MCSALLFFANKHLTKIGHLGILKSSSILLYFDILQDVNTLNRTDKVLVIELKAKYNVVN